MNGRRLVVGVTGGIAAYKTAALLSRLVQGGAEVHVVMTRAAEKFIGPDTFAALTGRPVLRQMFGDAHHPLGAHIDLAGAELLCVAPATANFMARAAQGLTGDLLSTLYLAFKGRVLFAPAMNDRMWQHPAVQRNVELLRGDGVEFVGPEAGWLSCRTSGPGRMADPEQILAAIVRMLAG
jgi:phosphopantothenoylcysteine decarboxylase